MADDTKAPEKSALSTMIRSAGAEHDSAGEEKWVLCNAQLQHNTLGVHCRTLKHAEDHTLRGDHENVVPWGAIVWGRDHGDGWLECGDDRFLPFQLSGCKVLHNYEEVEDQLYQIDNGKLQHQTHGVGFRASMNLEDKLPPGPGTMAYWNATVIGVESDDGQWLRVGACYLPMFLEGKRVVQKIVGKDQQTSSCFEGICFGSSSTKVASGVDHWNKLIGRKKQLLARIKRLEKIKIGDQKLQGSEFQCTHFVKVHDYLALGYRVEGGKVRAEIVKREDGNEIKHPTKTIQLNFCSMVARISEANLPMSEGEKLVEWDNHQTNLARIVVYSAEEDGEGKFWCCRIPEACLEPIF